MLAQLHTFVYFISPSVPSLYMDEVFSDSEGSDEDSTSTSERIMPSFHSMVVEPSSPLDVKPLTADEEFYLDSVDDGTDEFKLFKRLAPYFRGQHHTTEISWRENISRDELQHIIQLYKNFLVIVIHTEE